MKSHDSKKDDAEDGQPKSSEHEVPIPPEAEGLWSTKVVAEYLGLPDRHKVRTLVKQRLLAPGVKIKGRMYWDPDVVKTFRDIQQRDADEDNIAL